MEDTNDLGDMTPEEIAGHIRELVLAGRRSRAHRRPFDEKNDLKILASWERELTDGYGVEKKAKK